MDIFVVYFIWIDWKPFDLWFPFIFVFFSCACLLDTKTFILVAQLTFVWTLMVLSIRYCWNLYQIDVKNALLNSYISKKVCKEAPLRYKHPPNEICCLCKTLYSIQHVPHAWFSKFGYVMVAFRNQSSAYDSLLFLRKTMWGSTILLLYVNDMIATSDDIVEIQKPISTLKQQLQIKDHNSISYFVILEVFSLFVGSIWVRLDVCSS